MRATFRWFVFVGLIAPVAPLARGQETEPAPAGSTAASQPDTIVPTDYLLLPAVGQYGRLPLHRDAVEAQLVAGTWKMPVDGDTVDGLDGRPKTWRTAKANDDGTLEARRARGGWAVTTFDSPAARVMMLEASGHATVFVNGEPHAGDPYGLGWLRLPVQIQQGKNTLLVHLGGQNFSVHLTTPPADVFFLESDRTLPTSVRDERDPLWAAVPLVNSTADWLNDATIVCRLGDDSIETPVAPLPPFSVRKVAFQLPAAGEDVQGDQAKYQVRLQRANGADKPLAEADIALKIVGAEEIHVRTFRSRIDGSVQPYAVRPAAKQSDSSAGNLPGMIVSLHGAAVECTSQIAQYAAKPWAHVFAPQGRRPYGFDWEAWGRIDALEALADARKHYPSDERHTYLTGHSMGGHGTWQLGVLYPDQFAAIGPSAGWVSFWSYGGGLPAEKDPNEIESLMMRGTSTSDTLKLVSNLANTGVYVLHGSADDNVPVEQARFMRTKLGEFHSNFAYYEQRGAGHWWGSECCDWPRMMVFFQPLSLPAAGETMRVDFTTSNPAVSSRSYWVSIEAQQKQLEPSQVSIRQNPSARRFTGTTSNVARLAIDVSHLAAGQPIDVALDGQPMTLLPWPAETRRLLFERVGDEWAPVDEFPSQFKGPNRYGTFNAVFDDNVLLVYGTGGTAEENAWALAKARYDAETFMYRGSGALEIIPDDKFDLNDQAERNVMLYGNQETNSAWPKLLTTSPVEVAHGQVRVGERSETGDDLAVLMVRPRPGSDRALVGVVAGTGAAGMRLTNRLRYFVSGIVYPDLMILGPDVLTHGAEGVRAAGFFGLDWKVDSGEIAWHKPQP